MPSYGPHLMPRPTPPLLPLVAKARPMSASSASSGPRPGPSQGPRPEAPSPGPRPVAPSTGPRPVAPSLGPVAPSIGPRPVAPSMGPRPVAPSSSSSSSAAAGPGAYAAGASAASPYQRSSAAAWLEATFGACFRGVPFCTDCQRVPCVCAAVPLDIHMCLCRETGTPICREMLV